jgi:hypothetical protein
MSDLKLGRDREKERPLLIVIAQLIIDLARVIDDVGKLWGKLKGKD